MSVSSKIKNGLLLSGLVVAAGQVSAADAPDALKAAPRYYTLRYEDDLMRLVEITLPPGKTETMHIDPYASVSAFDASQPTLKDVLADPTSTQNGQGAGIGSAPVDMQLPTCMTMGPRAAHQLTNMNSKPAHWYRLEIKRLDGDAIKTNWQQWYPWMLDPLQPVKDVTTTTVNNKPFSEIWPFPGAYDSVSAAPNNHKLRYEDKNIRVIEVTTRPGETENMHGHPYPSVFAYKAPGLQKMSNVFLVEDHPLDNHAFKKAGNGAAPTGMTFPTCRTLGPEAPHAVTNKEAYPLHFWRIEFKHLPAPKYAIK